MILFYHRSCSLLHPYSDRTVPSSTPLPGKGYSQSPLARDMRLEQDAAGPLLNSHYLQHHSPAAHGPPCPMGRGAQNSGPAHSLAAGSAGGRGAGVVRQLGGQEHRIPRATQHTSQESHVVNSKKECSIRIISVWAGHIFDIIKTKQTVNRFSSLVGDVFSNVNDWRKLKGIIQ